MGALVTGAAGAATASIWVDSLSALSREQAHAHTARAAMAAQAWTPRVFSASQDDAVAALSELIIPTTDTPGARAAHVNRFIDSVLHDAPSADRDAFLRGLAWMDARCRALYGKALAEAGADEQTALLTRVSAEGNPHGEEQLGREFFRALKSMTIDGYYTTEIGLRQELGDPGQLFLPSFPGCDHPEHM